MIRTIMLCGEQFQKDGKFYFKNVDAVINDFLEENDAEYVDLKILDGEACEVILIYKIKEEE